MGSRRSARCSASTSRATTSSTSRSEPARSSGEGSWCSRTASTRSTMPACATTRSSRRWGSREPSDEPDPVPRVLRAEPGAVPGDGGSDSDFAGAVVRQQLRGAGARDHRAAGPALPRGGGGAQALPPETLAALPELILPLPGSRGSAMQVLLAGRPALLAALRAAGLRDRIAVLARLEPWVPTDVAVYIHGQLAHAGAERRLFTPGAVARVARLTEGVPRGVNTIADASLAAAASVGAASGCRHDARAPAGRGRAAPPAPTRAAADARRGARRRRRLPARLRGEGHRRDRGPAGARDDGGRRRPPGRGRARRADARPA